MMASYAAEWPDGRGLIEFGNVAIVLAPVAIARTFVFSMGAIEILRVRHTKGRRGMRACTAASGQRRACASLPHARRTVACLSAPLALLALVALLVATSATSVAADTLASPDSMPEGAGAAAAGVAAGTPALASRRRGALLGALVADALALATHYEYDSTRILAHYETLDRCGPLETAIGKVYP